MSHKLPEYGIEAARIEEQMIWRTVRLGLAAVFAVGATAIVASRDNESNVPPPPTTTTVELGK